MALGRGLSAILEDVESAYDKELYKDLVAEIDIKDIKSNPFQPRKYFDKESLKELSQSIQKHGLIQPIIVIKDKDSKGYTLIAGERRVRATKLLGQNFIKAIIVTLEDKNLRELALIENIQRENLSPIELANSYKELIEEYKITQEALSNIIKKSRSQITNTLRILTLDETTIKLIEDKKITQGHAKVIVGLNKDDEQMIVSSIIGQKLSVRDTENLVRKIKNNKNKNKNIKHTKISYAEDLNLLKSTVLDLGFKCKINGNKITLSFDNIDKIHDLIKLIKKIQ